MMVRKLLLVEDDKGQQDLLKDAINDWNAEVGDRQFSAVFAASLDDARQQLETIRFDGALCDLRVPEHLEGEAKKPSGAEIAKIGLSDFGIPVGILSGYPADFDSSTIGHGMLAVFDKGDKGAHNKAVAWFGGLWPMLEVLDAARDNIRRAGAEVFANRIWPRWTSYVGLANVSPEELAGVVTRQYASHIAELLGLDNEQNASWHPFENYISPALQDNKPYTGDIYRIDDALWVVLSPQCDMANGSTETVLLARCDETKLPDWENRVAQFAEVGISQSNAAKRDRFFADLVNQNGQPSTHFLPPLHGRPILVDFRKVKVTGLDYLQQHLGDRVASVSPPFLANLTQRFGAHISRAGQPNIAIRYFA